MLMLFSVAVCSHHVWFVFDAHLVLISLALHNFHFVMPGSSYLVFGETQSGTTELWKRLSCWETTIVLETLAFHLGTRKRGLSYPWTIWFAILEISGRLSMDWF